MSMSFGEEGRATAWHNRATRHIEGIDCVEQGYLLIPSIFTQIAAGDFGAVAETAAAAAAIADRYTDADLAALARNYLGQAMLRRGDTSDGLALLDEAMLSVVSDEVSPVLTGMIYCSVIAGCQRIYALDRVGEWTEALTSWCNAQPQLVPFNGTCRVHRAEIMELRGDWAAAVNEAVLAAKPVSSSIDVGAQAAAACYRQAEIHRLRGVFDLADGAFRQCSAHGGETQPGLALLRLAEGQVEAAAKSIRRSLSTTAEELDRMRFLPAAVEILVAADAIGEARSTAEEIETVAERYATPVLQAMADEARGRIALAEGDLPKATASLRRAAASWQQFGAPYVVARIRETLSHAYRELGDGEGAELELNAARAVYQELGAEADLARVGKHGAAAGPAPADHGLTTRELQVLRELAAGKTNRAIAETLFVSQKTIDRHVSNIFVKLDVPSRSAATAFAYKHTLV